MVNVFVMDYLPPTGGRELSLALSGLELLFVVLVVVVVPAPALSSDGTRCGRCDCDCCCCCEGGVVGFIVADCVDSNGA